MTIEIRQMVIKSSVGSGPEKGPAKSSAKSSGKAGAANDDCGCDDGCEGSAGQQERRKMRSAMAVEWERMRER